MGFHGIMASSLPVSPRDTRFGIPGSCMMVGRLWDEGSRWDLPLLTCECISSQDSTSKPSYRGQPGDFGACFPLLHAASGHGCCPCAAVQGGGHRFLQTPLCPRFPCPAAVLCLAPSIQRQRRVRLPWLQPPGRGCRAPGVPVRSSALNRGQICSPHPAEAVCFTICEHQEEMKEQCKIPFSKALMVKNVLLGCLFHRIQEKKKKKMRKRRRKEREKPSAFFRSSSPPHSIAAARKGLFSSPLHSCAIR